jgi:iron complex outermembrane receptor protein
VLTNSPKHLAKFNISAPLLKEKIYGGFETTFAGSKWTVGGNTTDSNWLSNLVFSSRRLIKGFGLIAGIYNLFDKKYGHPASLEHLEDTIEQDGRSYRIKISYGFDFTK